MLTGKVLNCNGFATICYNLGLTGLSLREKKVNRNLKGRML